MLIAAFEGWSDAGAATTTVLQHLAELMQAEPLHAIGAEGYTDFQVHRPKVVIGSDGSRTLNWPDTKLYGEVHRPGESDPVDSDATEISDENDADGTEQHAEQAPETVRRIDGTRVTNLFLLAGVEPARDWLSFADEVLDLVDTWAIDFVVLLGSMFSDAPHSRPIVTSVVSENVDRHEVFGAERSKYEGPVGISTVVDLTLTEAGIETLSLWAQVPHYVHSTPSPKVTLALLDKLEELLDIVIPRGELLSEATEWESNINRIAAADEDMSRYIRGLEESRDETLAAETTGDAIALEFEKFLGSGQQKTFEDTAGSEREDAEEDAERDDAESVNPESSEPDPPSGDVSSS